MAVPHRRVAMVCGYHLWSILRSMRQEIKNLRMITRYGLQCLYVVDSNPFGLICRTCLVATAQSATAVPLLGYTR